MYLAIPPDALCVIVVRKRTNDPDRMLVVMPYGQLSPLQYLRLGHGFCTFGMKKIDDLDASAGVGGQNTPAPGEVV